MTTHTGITDTATTDTATTDIATTAIVTIVIAATRPIGRTRTAETVAAPTPTAMETKAPTRARVVNNSSALKEIAARPATASPRAHSIHPTMCPPPPRIQINRA